MNADPAAARTRRLKLALLTSLAGKGIATVVQLASLPLAIGALGVERFGVYAMLGAFLSWMSIVSVTITPGLTVQIISANARMDRDAERKILGSALMFSFGLAGLLVGGAQVLFHVVGLQRMFGAGYSGFAGELMTGLTVLSLFIALNVVLSVGEAAQAGYQNQYVHNLFLALGNVVTIILIASLVRARPTIANMITAVYAGPIAGRALSFVQLMWARRYLISGMLRIDLATLKIMSKTGSAFLLASVASFCYQSFSVYWVGRRIGPIAAAQMSVFITVLGVLGSLLLMFTQPLWPAIHDATVRNDRHWVRRSYLRIRRHLMLYVGLAAVTVALDGNRIIRLWIKSAPATGAASQTLLGLYLLLLAWEHLNYSFLIGLGRYWLAALSYFSGALIMLVSCTWLVTVFGVSGMLAAMCAGPLMVTAWIYPLKLRHLLLAEPLVIGPAPGAIPYDG
jgi:O-antigen/teichoic acid export membrane protein